MAGTKKQGIVKSDDNVIYVGNKPFGNYMMACKLQLLEGNEIYIKARGKQISKAVDLAEVLKNNGIKNRKVDINEMYSESTDLNNKSDKPVRVSQITIKIK